MFFLLSKILSFAVNPSTWITIVFTLLIWSGLKRKPKVFISCICILSALLFLPIGAWLMKPLETAYPQVRSTELPDAVHGFIALGGAHERTLSKFVGEPQVNTFIERDLTLIEMSIRYPLAKAIFTGGIGGLSDRDSIEAFWAKQLYKKIGVPEERIIFESESRNTFENATKSFELLSPNKQDNWVLITTAWHMPRAVGVFCKAGWSVIPYPVDYWLTPKDQFRFFDVTSNLGFLRWSVREWVGLIVYRIVGKTDHLISSSCPPE